MVLMLRVVQQHVADGGYITKVTGAGTVNTLGTATLKDNITATP
jgi:hypothetical protein